MKKIIFAGCAITIFGVIATVSYAQTNHMVVKLDDQTEKLLTNSLQDTWFKKEAFGSTILGAALAIVGGFAATWLSDKIQTCHRKKEEAEYCKNLVRAIRCEIEALHQIYDSGMCKILNEMKADQILMVRLALTEDWFTVYNANAANIGRIDGKLSLQIVTVYMLIKKLIEQYRINNGYISELESVTRNPVLAERSNQIKQFMIYQITRIKEADKELKHAKSTLIEMFDEAGIK